MLHLQMGGKASLLVGIFVVLCLCWSAPTAYGQVTDAVEVNALLAVRNKLQDPDKHLNWTRKSDPCASKWTGVICGSNYSDGYFHVEELRLIRMNLSGTLSPELGRLIHMKQLDFLWNHISGSIPKEIGNITALVHLLLSGNQITGPLPDELGFLPNLDKFQLDLNMISGPIPKTFANLAKVKHFHMNNNRFSGQIPPEIGSLPLLKHILLDNNNLTGYLPPELALMPSLTVLQLDNNDFAGTTIPDSYVNMPKLVKLSLRNCRLEGTIPDFSRTRRLLYLDLSMNQLTGKVPTNRLAENITTIILSHNEFNGSIPANFSGLPRLQKLHLNNNLLSGSVPSDIWENIDFTPDTKLEINLENNLLSDISGTLNIPPNVTLSLRENPVCTPVNQRNISLLCGIDNGNEEIPDDSLEKPVLVCPPTCPSQGNFRYLPTLPDECFCAAPFGVGLRLRSPSISSFPQYLNTFLVYITSNVGLQPYQLYVDSISWEIGPRLRMFLLFFPNHNKSTVFETSEILDIAKAFSRFSIPGDDVFGPYDLLNFTADGIYQGVFIPLDNSGGGGGGGGGLSKGALAGIILGSLSCAGVIVASFLLFFQKRRQQSPHKPAKDKSYPKLGMKVEGVKAFDFEDLEVATNSFRTQIGQGGYGKVYKGTLPDGAVVAIKRAQQGSLQGDKEFYTEIEMLSRLHHRNLVSLVGYCDEKDEQMLVYEFMPNGSLHDLLSAKYRASLNLQTRLHIALGASRGILYLHTEADPPIIHRDIKANNILLDSKWTAKVSDFGISRLAPVSDARGVTTDHVSTNVKGTPGYVDPEYFLTHKLTEKSDVYSLGVVFLELLTGMQPIAHGRNIVREVSTACQSGMMFSVVDRTMGPYPSETIKKLMGLALRCSMDETDDRPTMLEVVRELETISSLLPDSGGSPTGPEFNPNIMSSANSVASPLSSSLYDERRTYVSTELMSGGELVSGVIPTISPR